MVNQVILVGRCARDTQWVSTSGTPMARMRIATTSSSRHSVGERQEAIEFHSIVVFGGLRRFARLYCHKGRRVYLEGRLRTRECTASDGARRWSTRSSATRSSSSMHRREGRRRGAYCRRDGGGGTARGGCRPAELGEGKGRTSGSFLFPLGNVVPCGALRVMDDHGINASELLRRHASGDWGDLGEEDPNSRSHLRRGSAWVARAIPGPSHPGCTAAQDGCRKQPRGNGWGNGMPQSMARAGLR